MSITSIIEHMNDHHAAELAGLVKLYGGFEATEIALVDVTEEGMKIQADGKEVFAPFPSKTEPKDYKDAIIGLCMAISKKDDQVAIASEIESFKDEFNTILLSSISKDNKPHISYSPLLRYEGEYYLYVSEVATHCQNLRTNPDSVQAMFIEDESKAKSILARKRLTYDASVTFLSRDALFDKVYDSFEARVGKSGGVGQVRSMQDFHLVKLQFKEGRFVKGFGQAYNIDTQGKISHVGGGMPHTMPHKHK